MVKEERVKQLYKLALYEQSEEKLHRQTGKYYRSDYIGKEILKSIFTGTLAYLFVSALFIVNRWEKFMEVVNHLDVREVILPGILLYAAYMIIYLIVTYVVYKARYDESRARLDEYEEELRVLNQMYEREEKLKI